MVKAEAELKAQIDGLLNRAKAADEPRRTSPIWTSPARSQRRTDRLAAIAAAKLRLEQRQREADAARGRSEDDDHKPRDKDGKPKRGRQFSRDFGVPKDSAQENFTDPDSRIMKRAGGGFDYSYNAQTAVDETAQIIVAAELTNNASDGERLPMMLAAVKANLGEDARQVLADAGFRSEAVFEQLKAWTERADRGTGPGGQAGGGDRRRTVPTHRGDGSQVQDARSTGGLPQEEVDRGGAQRVDQERAGLPAVQPAGTEEGRGRVQARVHGAEPEKDVRIARCLRGIEGPRTPGNMNIRALDSRIKAYVGALRSLS